MRPKYKLYGIYVMMFITLFLITGTAVYLSHTSVTEESLRADKNIITLNGPWKFTTGDSTQYAQPAYLDSAWESIDLTAPPGAHDGDVGLSGFVPGWTAYGHPKYSGYAWYRLKVSVDTLPAGNLALTAPPAVDNVYQLFVNGSFLGSAGDFSGKLPIIYSIRPNMFLLPGSVKGRKMITIAFRVWMSPAALSPGAGGIHIAPAIGEKTHIEKKYTFQWQQTIKGYIVEVVLPVMFVLLAIMIFLLDRGECLARSYLWFIIALILVGLVRLNQAVYFWFQIESSHQAVMIGSVILRPLMLGSWLMAWWQWFNLHQPKWLPKLIAILTLLHIAILMFGFFWVSNHVIHANYQTIVGYIRWMLLVLMLVIAFKGIAKQGKGLLVLATMLFLIIGLFPSEVSQLNIIPGIWFPYGVGVSRSQFFYAAFVFAMYMVLIQQNRVNINPVKK